MPHDRHGITFDIVGGDKVAAIERGIGACHLEKRQRSTRTCADGYAAVCTCGADKGGNVPLQIGIHMDSFNNFAEREYLFCLRNLTSKSLHPVCVRGGGAGSISPLPDLDIQL